MNSGVEHMWGSQFAYTSRRLPSISAPFHQHLFKIRMLLYVHNCKCMCRHAYTHTLCKYIIDLVGDTHWRTHVFHVNAPIFNTHISLVCVSVNVYIHRNVCLSTHKRIACTTESRIHADTYYRLAETVTPLGLSWP